MYEGLQNQLYVALIIILIEYSIYMSKHLIICENMRKGAKSLKI